MCLSAQTNMRIGSGAEGNRMVGRRKVGTSQRLAGVSSAIPPSGYSSFDEGYESASRRAEAFNLRRSPEMVPAASPCPSILRLHSLAVRSSRPLRMCTPHMCTPLFAHGFLECCVFPVPGGR